VRGAAGTAGSRRCVTPAVLNGDLPPGCAAPGCAAGRPAGYGVGDGDFDGDFEGDFEGDRLGEALGDGVGGDELGGVLGLGEGDGEWDGEWDTDGVGEGVWLAGTAGKIRAAEKYADHHTLCSCTTCPKVAASTIWPLP